MLRTVYLLGFLFALLAAFLAPGTADAQGKINFRLPAVSGSYYPADPNVLLKTIQDLYAKTDTPEYNNATIACIAPSGPYTLAGEVAANAFKNLKPGQYDRVIILSPSHLTRVENCSIPAVDAFITPLGPVPLDSVAIQKLLFSTLFDARSIQYVKKRQRDQVHEYEWGIEVLLPYLQERLVEFKLVPIIVGELTDAGGKYNPHTAEIIAEKIREIITPRTLIVVSSNFTHFGNDFSFRPFNDNILKNIEHLDRKAFDPLLALDAAAFEDYLQASRNVIDGKRCIEIMLDLIPQKSVARILAYEVSAEKDNNLDRSISFAAFTFHDPERNAPEAHPDKVRPLSLMNVTPASQYTAEIEKKAALIKKERQEAKGDETKKTKEKEKKLKKEMEKSTKAKKEAAKKDADAQKKNNAKSISKKEPEETAER